MVYCIIEKGMRKTAEQNPANNVGFFVAVFLFLNLLFREELFMARAKEAYMDNV